MGTNLLTGVGMQWGRLTLVSDVRCSFSGWTVFTSCYISSHAALNSHRHTWYAGSVFCVCVCVCEVCFGLFCEMWQPLFSGSHIKYSALPMPVLCLYFVLSLTCSSLMFFCVLSFTKEHILCIDMHKRRCKINISIVTGSLLSV